MKLHRLCVLLPILLFVACDDESETSTPNPTTTQTGSGTTTGVGGNGSGGEAAGGGSAGSGAFDLQDGTWELQNASNTADTMSNHGALAITASGDVWIAFSEPLPDPDYFDQDIFTTVRTGTDFEAATALTSDTDVQNAFSALVADGEQLHLVYNGAPALDADVFYATYDGSWGAPSDLTTPSESGPARTDYDPDLALTQIGDPVVVYLSEEQGSNIAEVRVVRLSGGVPVADPVTIIPAGTAGCWSTNVAVDSSDNIHVVAECGSIGSESIHYATNRTGSWATDVLAGGAGEAHTSADVAVGPDGTSVHVVWQSWATCSDGSCADLAYAVSTGSTFGAPVAVTTTVDETEASPVLAIDGAGRPLVMFSRANAQYFFDIFVINAPSGGSFGPEVNVTPGTDGVDQWMPYGLTFHPQTGLPHLTFTEILGASDPADTEVYHAQFVPTP